MPSPDISQWITELWPAVCARARRPVSGVLLSREDAGEIAEETFLDFLEAFPRRPGTWETVQHWLTTRVAPAALALVAARRRERGDSDLCRDPDRAHWLRNPAFDDLRCRDADGALMSREWSVVEPILWKRAQPVLARVGVSEHDAQDVFMEALAEFTRVRKPGAEPGPFDRMLVFEELPRFFATMAERRGISWLRKVSAQKRAPMHPGHTARLDDPDSGIARTLAAPGCDLAHQSQPWENAGFHRIHAACRTALTDFEWHLVETLFVEGTHTRLDLAGDAWVLEQIGLPATASESKRRRRLNLFIDEALARLGRALQTADV